MVSTSNSLILHKENKSEIVKQCQSIDDKILLREKFYKIGIQILNGSVGPDLAVSTFYEIIKTNEYAANIVCDVITILDIESQVLGENDSGIRENFIEFLKLANNTIISDWLLKERLDYSTIAEAKVINNEKAASTKFIKLKTKLYYKQQKFNLFREESEGYSKLLTELCQNGEFDPEYMLNAIKSLIGCFNLDPNRVLDIILECFEARIHLKDSFICLIKNFSNNPTTLNLLLAFKFSFYNNNDIGIEIPSALYDVAALLLNHNLIDLENLYPYLSPPDSKIAEIHQNEVLEAKNFSKKISTVLSVEGAKLEDIDVFEGVKNRKIGTNQKLGLILALLKLGDWNNASVLMQKLPQYYAISHQDISDALSSLVHYLIGPLYRKYSGLPPILASRIPLDTKQLYPLQPINDVDQFRKTILPMVLAFGPYLYTYSLLMAKLLRILRTTLEHKFDDFRFDVLSLLNVTVLPSFSLIESNSALVEELWSLLKLFPYNERFLLYNIWKISPTNPLEMKMKCFTMRKIKYIMKRISKDKESIKQSGRLIGKLSHSNPTFLFEYMLGQIQSYDNLIGPVVDSLKYLSSLSYDVLQFCVIEALSNPSKEHSKHEGTTISPWLLSLANFCGSVIKKYQIELPGLLQFVANQLKVGKCLDLLILKEIVQKMTGIETSEEMTIEQLEASSGGELLRTEGGTFNQIRNIKKSTIRLKEALLENNLAMPLCILMAQQRNCIVFQSENTHLKLIGKLYDQCQETLVQYGNFLSNALTIDDYKKRLPSLKELSMDYHLSPDVTFFLIRPMINHDINSVYEELIAGKAEKSKTFIHECYNKACETVLNPMIESITPELFSQLSIDLKPRFFVTFWTLSIYDVQFPEKSYFRERSKINQQIQQLEDNKDMVMSKKRKEKERLVSLNAKLVNEANQQSEHVAKVISRLENEKKYWFESNINKMDVTTNFLQHCLIPRCKFTALDALYCAKFVHQLHCLKTPNFSTLICFDRIFGDISYTMSSCTENEANHYGRFLCAILQILMRWHKDIKLFNAECDKFPGFVTKFSEEDPVHIDYQSYRHVCHKWHYRLTKAFILCLDSGDYIQIRNSLIVLTKLLPYFPIMISFAQAIERRLEKIRVEEKDKRPDLFVIATGYSGQLKLKKGSFIPESEFHLKENKKKVVPTNSMPPSSHVEQPIRAENNEDPTKKEHPSAHKENNNDKTSVKVKNSKISKNPEPEIDSKKIKEPKVNKVVAEEKIATPSSGTSNSNSGGNMVKEGSSSKIESRASSVSSSPKRNDYRMKEDTNDDYRKRKMESTPRVPESSRVSQPDETNKRFREDSQNRSSTITHEKKSLRKRQTKDSSSQESPDIKRNKKEEEKPLKRNDEREARKSTDRRTSSRRYKTETEK